MPSTANQETSQLTDRRESTGSESTVGRERRQFSNSYDNLSPEAAELAKAIDQYKMQHRRRFVDFEEMLSIFKTLGYHRS